MLSTAARNLMLDALTAVSGFLGLHQGVPDDVGSGEAVGAPYARLAITWNPAASRITTKGPNVRFDTPSTPSLFTFAGLWSASTAGTFWGRCPLGPSLRGVATVDDGADTFTSPAHGLVDGDRVAVEELFASLPSGLSLTTLYYVVGSAANVFQLALTLAGPAVAVGNGVIAYQSLVPRSYPVSGYLTIDTLALNFQR